MFPIADCYFAIEIRQLRSYVRHGITILGANWRGALVMYLHDVIWLSSDISQKSSDYSWRVRVFNAALIIRQSSEPLWETSENNAPHRSHALTFAKSVGAGTGWQDQTYARWLKPIKVLYKSPWAGTRPHQTAKNMYVNFPDGFTENLS